MWSKNGTPVETSVRPVPSRSSSRRISVSDVARSTFATRPIYALPSRTRSPLFVPRIPDALRCARTSSIAARNRSFSLVGAHGHPKAVLESRAAREVAHQHGVAVEQVPPHRRGVLHSEQHEVRLAREDVDALHRREAMQQPVTTADDLSDRRLEHDALVEHVPADPLGEAVHRVRLPHLHELADDVFVREHVAEAQPCQRERLRERAEDDEVPVAGHVGPHGVSAELEVRLVHEHEGVGAR